MTEKPRRGRPRAQHPLSARLVAWVTPSDRDAVEQRVEREGFQSTSELIRSLLGLTPTTRSKQ